MPTTIVVANQKGGVGKTTTAVNLAAGLARAGLSTLLVDLDMQGSATAMLAARDRAPDAAMPTIADCLERETSFDPVVLGTSTPGLSIAPSGEAMATVDMYLANAMARERVLSRCLAQTGRGQLDAIVIDTAPYLGLVTLNALVAADWVLVPVTCEYLPILGLALFNEMLTKIRARVGARAHILGYLLTLYDRRERITLDVEAHLRSTYGDLVLPHPIRVSTRHKASASRRMTIFEYDGKQGKGRADYELCVSEVMSRAGLAGRADISEARCGASSRGEDACAPRASSVSA
jgi:chromosome partitioning protein